MLNYLALNPSLIDLTLNTPAVQYKAHPPQPLLVWMKVDVIFPTPVPLYELDAAQK